MTMELEFPHAKDENLLNFSLYEIHSRFFPVDYFLKEFQNVSIQKTIARKRFAICTQQSTTLACIGIEFWEHFSFGNDGNLELFTVYLSKLDSTGLVNPRLSQRNTIQTIVQVYLKHFVNLSTRLRSPEFRFHVYARSNPEYLFRGSSKLQEKGKLEGRNLVYWWKNTLDFTLETLENNVKCNWIIPGITLSQLPMGHRSSSRWKYEYPNGSVSAISNIPQFEDDSKSKCLYRSFSEDFISTKSFIENVLANSPDFIEGDAGLFVLSVETAHNAKKGIECHDEYFTSESISQTAFEKLKQFLDDDKGKDNQFDTIDHVKLATLKLLDILNNHEISPIHFSCPLPTGKERKRFINDAKSIPTTAVNVLAVKRRKKE